jgi:O-antigen biosynthesis protein WbqP
MLIPRFYKAVQFTGRLCRIWERLEINYVGLKRMVIMKIYPRVKRCVDVVLSLIGLILLLPLFVLIAILIRIDSKGPVFFKQKRVGKHKKHFYILKFRTMIASAPKDVPTHLTLNSDQLSTKLGKLLRKSSMDELPQLINILRGEMSIIGPRPALWNQYDLIEERDKYGANNIVPGLTGWAQINGRDEITIEVKSKYDGVYVEKLSFWFDVKCIYWTVVKVLKSDGIVDGGPMTEGLTENNFTNESRENTKSTIEV